MLAYVFWHWPQPGVSPGTYMEHLRAFHQELFLYKPAGFLSSAAFQMSGAPWLPPNSDTYEDWYLVEGSCALDILNDAAVTPPLKESHDRSAHGAAGGTAGLYRLRLGSGELASMRQALWFSKRTGVSYEELYRQLQPVAEQGASLWGRQMTLGPSPEFCLTGGEDVARHIDGARIGLELVWP